jgi:hypothetical protein
VPTSHDRCFITKDATAADPAVQVAPACYLPGDTNPTPSNAVDWPCQICRPTDDAGYVIPGTNAGWNREAWNLAEMNNSPCNDNNPRTHTGVPACCMKDFDFVAFYPHPSQFLCYCR